MTTATKAKPRTSVHPAKASASKFFVIDADGHVGEAARRNPSDPEPVWLPAEFLEPEFKAHAPKYVGKIEGAERFSLEGHLRPKPSGSGAGLHGPIEGGTRIDPRPTGTVDPVARLKDMDKEGMDIAVLFGGMVAVAAPALDNGRIATALARAYNSWVHRYAQTDPKRLRPVATVAPQEMDNAIAELDRCVTELGFVGLMLPPNIKGKNLDHTDFYPLYEAAQRLDVPACPGHGTPGVHGIAGAGTERFTTFFYTHAVGHAFEQMIASMCVVTGGVMDRFPKLRFAFMESGCGWLPFWVERMGEHYEKMGGEAVAKAKPSEYTSSDRFYVSCDPDEELIDYVAEKAGAEHILYASDYWHFDSRFPHSVSDIRDRKGLSADAKRKILGENAARLFKIPMTG